MPETRYVHKGRHAGVLVPLFSMPSRGSWGVGEIPDLPRFARWMDQGALGFVQLLPVNEMEEGQNSPYSALSAMAIDPIFVAISDVPEFAECGGEASLDIAQRERLAAARACPRVDYGTVRALKTPALGAAFAMFRDRHWKAGSERDASFHAFADRQRWWLDDYALFRALHDENGGRYWLDWQPDLRNREPEALSAARKRLATAILYYQYVQWIADEQWRRARRDCAPVGILGDFPFMVSGHSADVWSRQYEFRVDASVGVPPDAFSETGQNWGLPVYRWDVMERNDYEWLRQRVRRCTELYDGFRIDHLVGFYRTFVRERNGRDYFTPADEPSQLAQGERLMRLFCENGACIIAEDLGTVPDFVRESLARLGVPGLKVLRWEREWKVEHQPFRRPSEYPPASVAISSTHDTDTLAEWWDGAGAQERQLCAEVPGLEECNPGAPFSPATRDALLRAIFSAASDLVIVAIQDVFGWRDRINIPAVVSDDNWSWRLPWPVDTLTAQPEARERAAFLRTLVHESRRS